MKSTMNKVDAAIGEEEEKRHANKEIDPFIGSGWHAIVEL